MAMSIPVCLSVHSHISETPKKNNYVHVDCCRGSVLCSRRCDTLYTSGFVDDVMSSHNRFYGASGVFLSVESVTAEHTSQISLNDKGQQVYAASSA